MTYDMKCEECNNTMHQIGPFASIKLEGHPTEKWDGKIDFECTTEGCSQKGIIKKIKPFFDKI